jgi:hypothetical protein
MRGRVPRGGTDLHILSGEYPVRPGLIVGHEPVGVIEELGPGATGYQPGDHVLVGAITPCRQCRLSVRAPVPVRVGSFFDAGRMVVQYVRNAYRPGDAPGRPDPFLSGLGSYSTLGRPSGPRRLVSGHRPRSGSRPRSPPQPPPGGTVTERS